MRQSAYLSKKKKWQKNKAEEQADEIKMEFLEKGIELFHEVNLKVVKCQFSTI